MAAEDDVKIIGCILKAISAKEIIDVSSFSVQDEDAIAGWTYYATLSDKEGNLRLKGFEHLVCSCARIAFVIDNIAEKLLNYLKSIGLKLKQFFDLDDDTKWDDDSEKKVLEEAQRKAEECYPLIAKALFRYFGKKFKEENS